MTITHERSTAEGIRGNMAAYEEGAVCKVLDKEGATQLIVSEFDPSTGCFWPAMILDISDHAGLFMVEIVK